MNKGNDLRLETESLCIGYVGKLKPCVLFENLQLVLRAGELVCLMGPNGVGKSTLIRTLAGIQKPLSGQLSPSNEKDISVVLTDRVAASNMTVYDLVCYGRYPYLDWNIRLRPEDKDIVERSLDQVQIAHLADKSIYELSDGQMQMAMIARALTQDTPLLLLDEPTAHLDLNNRVEIMNLLRKLSRTMGKAILVSTHELDLALQTADLIWLATRSKTIKSGIPEDLVLDGSLDDVFQFKGFDLRTGKMEHEVYRTISIHLVGEGPQGLWTKNALERSGYRISDSGPVTIEVIPDQTTAVRWILLIDGKTYSVNSIRTLLEELDRSSPGL